MKHDKTLHANIDRTACGTGWIVEYRRTDDRVWTRVYVGGNPTEAHAAYRRLCD